MKKFLAILLCVAMTAAIVACGGTQTPGTSGATEGTSASTTSNSTTGTSGATTATTTYPVVPPVPGSKTFDENNIVLSFGAISDIHITGNGSSDDSESKFRAALTQLKTEAAKHDRDGLDAVTIAGDIADTGKKTQVSTFTRLIKNSGIENVMLVPGNHDHYGEAAATLKYYIDTMG